jgi:hypothetical protein
METALPCNSGGHRSLAHFEKYFGRFPKKAEMEIKIEQGGNPSKSEYISFAASQQQRSISEFASRAESDDRLR